MSDMTAGSPLDLGGPVDRPFEPFPHSALAASITERFEATARRFSTRVAVSDGVRQLTYSELAILVDRIADAIAAAVADRAGPVAILLPRNVHFPAAMLGVLAAGRGCVPLDASNPRERNRLIATQSGAAAVVSAGDLATDTHALFPRALPVVDVETIGKVTRPRPVTRPGPDDLAFIVYTSGSTGRPKGAYHDHRNLLHDVMQQTNSLHLNHEDRVALVYSPALVGAIREIMMTLLNGAALHILPPHDLLPAGLVREIQARGITVFRLVPVLLRRITEVLAPDQRLDSVRVVGLGSQRVDWSDFDLVRRHFAPQTLLIVGIGSTECGGNFCHWFVDDRLRATSDRLPIGRVLPDARVTIIDASGHPLPDGEIGEIRVASRYLALGYWRDPEATAARFTTDPTDPAARIFNTGDVGRIRRDGLLEFIGRNDQQIKLRGHRIEIGEIEFALGKCAGVEDAAVMVRRNEAGLPRSLCAYLELQRGSKEPQPRDLKATLRRRLPGYMIPATFHVFDALPRLPNLKIDRRRLAEIDATHAARTTGPITDPVVAEVASIFDSVLGSAGASPEDNVLSLGGDSLQVIKVAIELEARFRMEIPAEVFEASQNIGELARWIKEQQAVRPVRGRSARAAP
jgi:amino acid adenylation domain-containing protein